MNEYMSMRVSVKRELLWQIVIMMIVLCIIISVLYSVANIEPAQKRCIDGTLYRQTDQGYWLAYNNNRSCKVLPIEEISE